MHPWLAFGVRRTAIWLTACNYGSMRRDWLRPAGDDCPAVSDGAGARRRPARPATIWGARPIAVIRYALKLRSAWREQRAAVKIDALLSAVRSMDMGGPQC